MRNKKYFSFILAIILIFSEVNPVFAYGLEDETSTYESMVDYDISSSDDQDVSGTSYLEEYDTNSVFGEDVSLSEDINLDSISDNDHSEMEENDYADDISGGESTDPTVVYTRSSGKLTYTLSSDGTLVIEGNGNFRCSCLPQSDTPVKKVIVRTTGATQTTEMFKGLSQLVEVDLSAFDTSSVFAMNYMFYGCSSLKNLDLTSFDTSSALYMDAMFENCSELTRLDLSNFDTTSVTNMQLMFFGCSKLSSLNLGSFDTSSVTDMQYMFAECKSLTNLDLHNFNGSSVKTLNHMFKGCNSLVSLDLSNFATPCATDMERMFSECEELADLNICKLSTSSVTNMNCMFSGCSSLSQLDLSKFDTSSVTNMNSMFDGCSSLIKIDLSNSTTASVTDMKKMFCCCQQLEDLSIGKFSCESVTTMREMFRDCNNLSCLNLNNFVASPVTDMSYMFKDCSKLTDLKIDNFAPSSVTNMNYLFSGCSSLLSLDLSKFDTSSVTDMRSMFDGCSSLTCLDLSKFDTSSVSDMREMFRGCSSLTSIDLSKFDTSSVTDMGRMFYGCSSLTNLDLSKFDTSSVTNVNSMFSGCSSLTSLNIASFDTSSVKQMDSMFYRCSSLLSLDLSKFDTSSVTNMGRMFCSCSALTYLDLSKFDTSSVIDMQSMFEGCSSLTSLNISSFDTSSVKSMNRLFLLCSNLTNIELENFNTSSVTDTESMFEGCKNLEELNLRNFDTTSVTNMRSMFSGCSKLSYLDLGGWDLSSLTNSVEMFSNCTSLDEMESPVNLNINVWLPKGMADVTGKRWGSLPRNVSKSMTLIYPLVQRKYRISFDSNESSIMDYFNGSKTPTVTGNIDDIDYETARGKSLPENKYCIKGYEFVGWNTKKDGTGDSYVDMAYDPIFSTKEEYVVLHAQWKKTDYKIEYDGLTYEQAVSFGLPVVYAIDSDTIVLSDYASKVLYPGCVFKGFYTSKKYEKAFKTIPTGSMGDKKIYVKLLGNKYKVVFNRNEKSIDDCALVVKGSGKMNAQSLQCGKRANLIKNTFKVSGYDFAGWNTKEDGSGDSYADRDSVIDFTYVSNDTVTLYAQWKKANYKIYYNGLTEDEVVSNDLPTSYCIDSNQIILNDFAERFSRIGYDFKGLYTTKKYDKKFKSINTGSTGNKTIYVKLVPHKYKLSFNKNIDSIKDFKGTKLKTSGSMKAQTVTYGKNTAINKNGFKVAGYNLVEWNTLPDGSGTSYSDRETIINLSPDNGAVIQLYAIWEKTAYKISYSGLTTKEVEKFNLPTTYRIDDETILLEPYKNAIERTGYTFKNFYSDKKYKNVLKNIKSGSTGNKTVYVKMVANKYKLSFMRNEASLEEKPKCSGKMNTQIVTYDKIAKISVNAFKINGYTFVGWNTEADGKGVSYANKGQIKNLTPNNGETIILYARWIKKGSSKIDINPPTIVDISFGAEAVKVPSKMSVTITASDDISEVKSVFIYLQDEENKKTKSGPLVYNSVDKKWHTEFEFNQYEPSGTYKILYVVLTDVAGNEVQLYRKGVEGYGVGLQYLSTYLSEKQFIVNYLINSAE